MKILSFLTLTFFCVLNVQAQWNDSGSNLTTSDNVGIGTTTPAGSLHIKNTSASYATIESTTSNAYWVSNIGGNNGGGLNIKNLGVDKAYIFWTNSLPSRFAIWVNGSDRFVIRNDGKVGIGTKNPTELLSVNGKIESEEIEVKNVGADFVFEEDYNLMSLENLAQFIKENKHLPEIEPASVTEKGVELGAFSEKLLQKIEELVLYTIDQEKRISELEEKISTFTGN